MRGSVVCPKCGTARYGSFVYEPIQKYMSSAVPRSVVARLPAPAALAGVGCHAEIMVSAALSREVKRALKGIVLKRVPLFDAKATGPFKIVKLKKSDVGG